jgi:hypothetical protein
VYGEIDETLASSCSRLGLAAHAFGWNDFANDAGIERDAMYLVRPDGHIALASPEQSVTALRDFLDRAGLRFPAAATEN